MRRTRSSLDDGGRLAWLTPPVLALALAGCGAALALDWTEGLLPALLCSAGAGAGILALAEAGGILLGAWGRRRARQGARGPDCGRPLLLASAGSLALAPLLMALGAWPWAFLGRVLGLGARDPGRALRRSLGARRAKPGTEARQAGLERLLAGAATLAAGLGLGLGAWLGIPARGLALLGLLPALAVLGLVWRWSRGWSRAQRNRDAGTSSGALGPGRWGRFWDARAWTRPGPEFRRRAALRTGAAAARWGPAFFIFYVLLVLLPRHALLGSLAWAGLFWAAGQAARLAGFTLARALEQGRRLPGRALLGSGWLCSGLGAWILGHGARGLGALAGAMVLAGLGLGLAESVEEDFALQAADPAEAGTARALLEAAVDLGAVLGCLGCGWLWTAYGPGRAFSAAAALLGLCVLGLLLDSAPARELMKDL